MDQPDLFRRELRVSPATFDCIVQRLIDDPVFANNSLNEQIPVEEQTAITLYWFGHNGNAASLDSVASWARYAKGTVSLSTCCVMTAILLPDFMKEAVKFPTDEEKQKANKWVAKNSCQAWCHGWWMVPLCRFMTALLVWPNLL